MVANRPLQNADNPLCDLFDAAVAELGGPRPSGGLLEEFLAADGFQIGLFQRLVEAARGTGGGNWEWRRLAALMAENQYWKLKPDDSRGLRKALRVCDMRASGASAVELRKKIDRRSRVHRLIQGLGTRPRDLREFVAASRCESKICLARHLFAPTEVVDRLLEAVRTSRGLPDSLAGREELACELPDYEWEILEILGRDSTIYWVSERVESRLEGMLSYPLGAVVLTVRPPGSDLELQIKRAGLRGNQALRIVHERDGEPVPPSHRLSGGSWLWNLNWQERAGKILASIYRRVHRRDAPLCQVYSVASIAEVPNGPQNQHLVDYLLELQGDPVARGQIQACLSSFEEELGPPLVEGEDPMSVALNLIARTGPAQSILVHSAALRIDLAERYLGRGGIDSYFRQGLGVEPTPDEARRFAEEVLDETLGVWTPPPTDYRSHGKFVRDVFSVPANRRRADSVYLDLAEECGRLWGTLLALGGFTCGESFVARNVGLKTHWSGGGWKVQIVFQDHDCLFLPGWGLSEFDPSYCLEGAVHDEGFLRKELTSGRIGHGRSGYLERIYRVDRAVARMGEQRLLEALGSAYRKTLRASRRDPAVDAWLDTDFAERLGDWDRIVRDYFSWGSRRTKREAWKKSARQFLRRKGRSTEEVESQLAVVRDNAGFLRRYRCLFTESTGRPPERDGAIASSGVPGGLK